MYSDFIGLIHIISTWICLDKYSGIHPTGIGKAQDYSAVQLSWKSQYTLINLLSIISNSQWFDEQLVGSKYQFMKCHILQCKNTESMLILYIS